MEKGIVEESEVSRGLRKCWFTRREGGPGLKTPSLNQRKRRQKKEPLALRNQGKDNPTSSSTSQPCLKRKGGVSGGKSRPSIMRF